MGTPIVEKRTYARVFFWCLLRVGRRWRERSSDPTCFVHCFLRVLFLVSDHSTLDAQPILDAGSYFGADPRVFLSFFDRPLYAPNLLHAMVRVPPLYSKSSYWRATAILWYSFDRLGARVKASSSRVLAMRSAARPRPARPILFPLASPPQCR